MEALYHIRPYFVGIFPYIDLIYGRYLQFRFLKWPLIFAVDITQVCRLMAVDRDCKAQGNVGGSRLKGNRRQWQATK